MKINGRLHEVVTLDDRPTVDYRSLLFEYVWHLVDDDYIVGLRCAEAVGEGAEIERMAQACYGLRDCPRCARPIGTGEEVNSLATFDAGVWTCEDCGHTEPTNPDAAA